MSTNNKRYLGVGILLCLVGGFKIYSKGIYNDDGSIHWFNLLVPFGMGVVVAVYVLTKIILERNKD
jgi:hypothetical protein